MPPFHDAGYSPEIIRELVHRLKRFSLEKSEVLMILNLRPSELGLLDCIIEECDERFSDEEQNDILSVVSTVLGDRPRITQGQAVIGNGNSGKRPDGSR